MSIEYIRKINEQKAREAKEQDIVPVTIHDKHDIESIKSLPFIGDYRPKAFKLCRVLFVDNSGLGADDEPALTFNQFVNEIVEGRCYAIIEAGQFQVRIAEFEQIYQ